MFITKNNYEIEGGDCVKRGTTLQMNIVELFVQGKKRKEIADELNCSLKTVDDVKADKDLRQVYYQKCNEQIEQLLPLALRELGEILNNPKTQGSVKIAAIKEVLDRSHLKELTNAGDNKINLVISYE